MAQMQTQMVLESGAELLQAQADLWRHSLCFYTSMALQCAVKLGVPAAIHRRGGTASLPEILAELSVLASKLPFLRRVMRLLTTSGLFAAENTTAAGVYRLTGSWSMAPSRTARRSAATPARPTSCSRAPRASTSRPRWGWTAG